MGESSDSYSGNWQHSFAENESRNIAGTSMFRGHVCLMTDAFRWCKRTNHKTRIHDLFTVACLFDEY